MPFASWPGDTQCTVPAYNRPILSDAARSGTPGKFSSAWLSSICRLCSADPEASLLATSALGCGANIAGHLVVGHGFGASSSQDLFGFAPASLATSLLASATCKARASIDRPVTLPQTFCRIDTGQSIDRCQGNMGVNAAPLTDANNSSKLLVGTDKLGPRAGLISSSSCSVGRSGSRSFACIISQL
jgi:hypothetical protein